MNNSLYVIDWSQVKPGTMQLLESGKARVINGVARDLGQNYQIVQHMPFRQMHFSQTSDLLNVAKSIHSSQAVIGSMMAISSVAVMGTVIISTAYLANKLNKIQKAIDILQQEISSQNLLYYSDRITSYFGAVEATRELISDDKVISENMDLIILKISELSRVRNQMISFLDNLVTLSDNFTPNHKSIAIDFINMTFNLIPKCVFVESQAAYKIERFYLGDSIRESAKLKYYNSIEGYRSWANNKIHYLIKGQVDDNTRVLQDKSHEIKSLVSSEENKMLLENSA